MNRTALVCTAAACCTVLASALLVAGPINPPPGAVSSSLKTLFEVEPRTPISSTTTPGSPSALATVASTADSPQAARGIWRNMGIPVNVVMACPFYTSDAADERSSVELGGRRII